MNFFETQCRWFLYCHTNIWQYRDRNHLHWFFCIVICLFAFGACYFLKRILALYNYRATVCKYSTRQSLFTYFVWLSIGWLLIDRFNRFCVVYGRKSLYFTIGDHFPKIAPSHGGSGPPLIHDSLGTQSKRHHDWFSCFRTGDCRVSLYFTMGDLFPKNCPFPWRDLDPHLTHDFLGLFEPTTQTASRSVQHLTASIKSPWLCNAFDMHNKVTTTIN